MAISDSFLNAATTLVTNSGNEVPMDTIVKPTNHSDIPNFKAMSLAAFVTKTPPATIPIKPSNVMISALLIGYLSLMSSTSNNSTCLLFLKTAYKNRANKTNKKIPSNLVTT